MKKNVLVLGAGGREHALVLKLSSSPMLDQLFCIPGNPGIFQLAKPIDAKMDDVDSIKQSIINHNIHIVICGPEDPLAKGLMDELAEIELPYKLILIGPKKQGALLEASKSFAKQFMSKYNIPTASYQSVTKSNIDTGIQFIKNLNPPIVLKANGLAAGKGVLICQTHDEAINELNQMLEGKFGSSSEEVVIESFLTGKEFSVFVLTNGREWVILPEAKDYKRIGEADTGLNTGGMGAISPVPFVNEDLIEKVVEQIIVPTVRGLETDQIPYMGFIFFGLIAVEGNPFVIEYNCRLGDPETEAIMPRLNSDLIQLFIACEEGKLNQSMVSIKTETAATVCLVSEGYPGEYEKGKIITGHENISQSQIFHSGVIMREGKLVTHGGRVLVITTLAKTRAAAIRKSLKTCEQIQFEGKYFRKDIGYDL